MDGHGRKRLLGAAPGVGGGDRQSNSLPRSSKAQRLVPMAMKTDEDILYRRIESGKERLPRDMWDLPRFDTRTPWYDCKTGGPTAVAQQREVRLWRTKADIVVKRVLTFFVEDASVAEQRLANYKPDNSDIFVQSGAAAPTLQLGLGEDGRRKLFVRRYASTSVYKATVSLTQQGKGGEFVCFSAYGVDEQQAKDIASYGAMRLLRDSAIVMGAPTVRDFTAALPTLLRLKDPRVDAILSQPPVGGWPTPLPPPQPAAPKPKAKAKPAQQQTVAAAAAKKPVAKKRKRQAQPRGELSYVESLLKTVEDNGKDSRRAGDDYEVEVVTMPTLHILRGDTVGTPPTFSLAEHKVSLEKGQVHAGMRHLRKLFPDAELRPVKPGDARTRDAGIALQVAEGTIKTVLFEPGRSVRVFKACISTQDCAEAQRWVGAVAWATTALAAIDEAAYRLVLRLDDANTLQRVPALRQYISKRSERGLLAFV